MVKPQLIANTPYSCVDETPRSRGYQTLRRLASSANFQTHCLHLNGCWSSFVSLIAGFADRDRSTHCSGTRLVQRQ